jgi:hypothetical protein
MVNILAKKSLNSNVLLFVFTQLVKISIGKKKNLKTKYLKRHNVHTVESHILLKVYF